MTIQQPQTFWVNVYRPGSMPHHLRGSYNPHPEPLMGSLGYDTKEEADKFACPNRIACVPLTFAEGDGL